MNNSMLLPSSLVVERGLMHAIMHFPKDPILRRRAELSIVLLQAREAGTERKIRAGLSDSDYDLLDDIGWNELTQKYREAKLRAFRAAAPFAVMMLDKAYTLESACMRLGVAKSTHHAERETFELVLSLWVGWFAATVLGENVDRMQRKAYTFITEDIYWSRRKHGVADGKILVRLSHWK